MAELTDTQIQTLLWNYLQKVLEKDQYERVSGKKDWPDRKQLHIQVDVMAYVQDDCYRELAIGNHSRATGAVDRLLKENGIKLDRDAVSYATLCREMMKVMINHLEIDIRRSLGDDSLEGLPFPALAPSPR